MGEDPHEDEVANLQGTSLDVAAVVAAQSLLVAGGTHGGVAPGLLEKSQFFVVLLSLGRSSNARTRGEPCLSLVGSTASTP